MQGGLGNTDSVQEMIRNNSTLWIENTRICEPLPISAIWEEKSLNTKEDEEARHSFSQLS